jgi:hypothetical protein
MILDADTTVGEMASVLESLGKTVLLQSANVKGWGRVTVLLAVDERSSELLDLGARYLRAVAASYQGGGQQPDPGRN